jgi:predicted DNA-binding protein
MTTLCPSCKEPVDHPSGDGCAAMKKHRIDWKAAMAALDASLPERLERLAKRAETSSTYVQEFRMMRAEGVADLIYEALDEIRQHRGIEE